MIRTPPSRSQSDKADYIRGIFARIAPRYDLANNILAGGMHGIWRKRTIALLHAPPGARVLDLCCGTGDLVFRLKRSDPTLRVTGIDFCAPMLDAARLRAQHDPHGDATFIEGDVMALPFEDRTFDGATMGFSLRNVVDIDRTLREVRRVLVPGAKFVNLDFSKAPNKALKAAFDLYFYHVVPVIGTIVGGSKEAYTYLPRSLTHHPGAEDLRERFEVAGFKKAGYARLMAGTIAIHYGTAL
jgi:demethylmenaquinone methyltransferase / 2-methoxy-6-polyprenyl-1,4-benzoquinol methylase